MKAKHLWSSLTLGALLATGCGSTDSFTGGNFSGITPGLSANDPGSNRGLLVGRVVLDTKLANAPVEITDTQGRVIYALTTDGLGWFMKRVPLPRDYTIRVRRGNDVYRTEVRGNGGARGTLYVNAGTTLVSAYLAAHPELTLAEAENKVRTYLKLPVGYKMAWISTVKHHAFKPEAFFQAVQQAGSLETYLAQQVVLIDVSPLLEAIASTTVEDVLKFAGQTAASTVLGSTINDTLGDALANCGWNFTTTGAIAQVQEELDQVAQALTNLTNGLNAAAALAKVTYDLSDLNTASETIATTEGYISTGVAAYAGTHPTDTTTNVPESPQNAANSGLTTQQSNLAGLDLSLALSPIVTNLLTDSVTYAMADAIIAQNKWNFPDAQTNEHYPWRSNASTNQIRALMAKYVGTLHSAAHLYFEQAQQVNGSGYATAMAHAAESANQVTGICQQAGQYVPDNFQSDDVLLDMTRSAMYYKEFASARNLTDAKDYLTNLSVGAYGEDANYPWHFPHSNDLDYLVKNRVLPLISSVSQNSSGHWDDASTSDWKNAFTSLGFDTTNYTAYTNPGNPAESNNEGSYVINDSGGSDNMYIWNNDGTNPDLDENDGSDSHTLSFLCQIDYPKANRYTADPQTGQVTDPAYQYEFNGDNLISPFSQNWEESNSIGVGQSSSNTTGTQMRASYDVPGGQFDITNRVYWTSSNSKVASVSNYSPTGAQLTDATYQFKAPGPAGFVTWHPPIFPGEPALTPVTISGQYHLINSNNGKPGTGASMTILKTATINPPNGVTVHVVNSLVRPMNQKYDLTGLAADAAMSVFFYMNVCYSDGRIYNVSLEPSTVWTLKNAGGTVLASKEAGGGFGVSSGADKNQCSLYNTVPGQTLTVSARWLDPISNQNVGSDIKIGTVTSVP